MSDNELPGMLAIAKGVAEQSWPHTFNALCQVRSLSMILSRWRRISHEHTDTDWQAEVLKELEL